MTTAGPSMLTRLCEVAVRELRMSGAVVSLMTPVRSGREQSGTIAAASSDSARSVEELEFALGEGPGRDAFQQSRPVLTTNLASAFGRWPGYVPPVLAAGVRATFAFPMLVGAARFGVFHLHCATARALSDHDTATCLMLTELAIEIVLDTYAPIGHSIPSDVPLLGPEDRRDGIYQAQGMVMVELGVSLREALARMRAHAFASDRELADVAADILSGRTRLQSDPDVAP
ncbi:MAG TPA: GAF and ANTAR domain-containing protein [Microlunatus sp.]|nr:GAF and ANTAR domain-containing protein [Microlunatus sp.]